MFLFFLFLVFGSGFGDGYRNFTVDVKHTDITANGKDAWYYLEDARHANDPLLTRLIQIFTRLEVDDLYDHIDNLENGSAVLNILVDKIAVKTILGTTPSRAFSRDEIINNWHKK